MCARDLPSARPAGWRPPWGGTLVLAATVVLAGPVHAELRPPPGAARPALAASAAAWPSVALWVEWREVTEVLHEETVGGREASVSATSSVPTGQGGTWSTLPGPDREPAPDHRVRLANGGSARIAWAGAAPAAWHTDVWLEAGPGPRPGGGALAGAIRPSVAWRPAEAGDARTLALTARWPGGTAPVAVDLRLDDPAAADGHPQHVAGSTLVPLDRWTTVVQLGGGADDGAAGGRGTVGTRRAEPVRLLQLRVRLGAPMPNAAPAPVDRAAERRRVQPAATVPDPRAARGR